jgi:hypothetical protein
MFRLKILFTFRLKIHLYWIKNFFFIFKLLSTINETISGNLNKSGYPVWPFEPILYILMQLLGYIKNI